MANHISLHRVWLHEQWVRGSMPTTYHTDEELSQIARDFGRLWLWSVQRWRFYVYAPQQHPHCADRWRRWADNRLAADCEAAGGIES